MKKFFAVGLCLLGVGLLAGCGTAARQAAAPAIGVSVSPSGTQGIDQSQPAPNPPQTKAFTPTVTNDSANKGVTWSLTQGGTSCSPGCGTISLTSSASGVATTYTAPATVPSPPTVTLTATSVADTSKSAFVTITVNPTPAVSMPAGCTTPPCALPPATPNAPYSVSLPTVLSLSGGTQPFTWNVIGSLPAGLMLNRSTGVISGTPMITKPGSFTAGRLTAGTESDFSVTVTDSGSPAITVPNPPLMLSITVQIGVTLSPNTPQTVVQGQTLQITATVTNDPQNGGVTWSATCSTSPCGSFNPTSTPSGTPTTYTAPSPVTANLTVTVTATSVTDNTRSASLMVTVTPPVPITVTLSPNTPQTVVQGQTLSITATVASDPANGGVNWTVTCSVTACGGVSPTSTASGTPTTYTAPTPVAANLTVTVTATSVSDSTKSASLTVTVTPATNNGALLGDYALRFTGFDSSGEVAVAGRFTADGNGGLSKGVLDFNTSAGSVMTTFTGTYTVGSDNRGILTANLGTPPGGTFTARFVLESSGNGLIIEFDDSTGNGTRGSGEIDRQDLTAASLSVFNGDFALGLVGDITISGANGRLGVVGRFTSDTTGLLSSGQVDVSVPGTSFSSPLTGKLNSPDPTTGRGTGTVTITTIPPPIGSLTLNLSYYIFGKHKAFVIDTDQRPSGAPLLSGELRSQRQPTFTASSLSGPIVFAVVGTCGSPSSITAQASVAVGQVQANGAGMLTSGMFDQNECGAINSAIPITGTYTVDTAVKGRVTITLIVNPTEAKPQMLYLEDINKGFLLEGTATTPGSEVTAGIIESQAAGPFTEASIATTYAASSQLPATRQVPNDSGVFTFTAGTPSTFSGTVDISSGTSPFLAVGVPFSGTYAVSTVSGSPPGRFTGTLNSPPPPSQFVIYAKSQTRLVFVDVTPGNTAAALAVFEH